MRQVEFQIPVTTQLNKGSGSVQAKQGRADGERNEKLFSLIVGESEVKSGSLDEAKVVETTKGKTNLLENDIESAIGETVLVPSDVTSKKAKAKSARRDVNFFRPEHQNLAIEGLKRHMTMARHGKIDAQAGNQAESLQSNDISVKEAVRPIPAEMLLSVAKTKNAGKNSDVDFDQNSSTLSRTNQKSERPSIAEVTTVRNANSLNDETAIKQNVQQNKAMAFEQKDHVRDLNTTIATTGNRQPINQDNAKLNAQAISRISAQADPKLGTEQDIGSKFNSQMENAPLPRKFSERLIPNSDKRTSETVRSSSLPNSKESAPAVANPHRSNGERQIDLSSKVGRLEANQPDDSKQSIRIISVSQSTQTLPNVLSQIPEKIGQLLSQELASSKQNMESSVRTDSDPKNAASKRVKSLTIQLKPEHLGTISVKMLLVGKKTEVTLMAESSSVASRLSADISNLRLQIQAAGISPDEFSISVKESEFGVLGKDPNDSDASKSFARDSHKNGKNANHEMGDGSSQGTSQNDRNDFAAETQNADEIESSVSVARDGRNGDKYI